MRTANAYCDKSDYIKVSFWVCVRCIKRHDKTDALKVVQKTLNYAVNNSALKLKWAFFGRYY